MLIACKSSEDDLIEYMGPWEIVYFEDFHGTHIDSKDFEEWFNDHKDDFVAAQFSTVDGSISVIYSASNGDWIEIDDYSRFYNGSIEWSESISKATESEIKAKVSAFETFTIMNERDQKYDKFSAYYEKSGK